MKICFSSRVIELRAILVIIILFVLLQIVMVNICAVDGCKEVGVHRFRSLLKTNSVNLPLRDIQDQRICKEHFNYFLEKENHDNQFDRNKNDIVYENIEFLDSSVFLQSNDDPLDDPLSYNDPDQKVVNSCFILTRVILYLVLCLTFIVNLLKQCFTKFITTFEKCKELEMQNKKLTLEMENLDNSIAKIYNHDQIDMMKRNLKRPKEWSDATILKSLKYKFACKKGGYSFMKEEGHPMPSERILRSRLQGINFNPGILEDVFVFLKEKVNLFTDFEKECLLVVDEMSIIEGLQYDIGTQSYIGKITVPLAKSSTETEATHALVFIIVGISSKYKQIVAYELTGTSVSGNSFLDIVINIVKKAWNIGLRCNGLVSDMGGSNGAVWRLWGLKATRNDDEIKNFITHPCDPNRKFWIFADPPHLLKNTVQNIRNNKVVIFDEYIVKAYELKCNNVKSSDFFDLFKLQQNDDLKLAPKLRPHILQPNTFQKMNVPVATNLIGSNVSTGLYYMYSTLPDKEQQESSYGTTAWFSQILTRWFTLMSSRHYSLSVTKQNFDEFSDELTEIMDIMKHAKFGQDGRWKPFQRGFLISTTSVLQLSKFLLTEKGFNYFLPSRGLQDCLENLFSTVRFDNPKPNAIQVRDSIKSISISEYLSPPVSNSSYEWDDSKFLSGFLNVVRSVRDEHQKDNETLQTNDKLELSDAVFDFDISKVIVNRREQNVLYKICCYILYKVITSKQKLHCVSCLSYCRSPGVDETKTYTMLMQQPDFKYSSRNYIHHVKKGVFEYFLKMEKLFRLVHPILSGRKKRNLGYFIRDHILDRAFECDIPKCHSLQKTLTTRFVAFRLKNAGKERLKKRNFDPSSHTMN